MRMKEFFNNLAKKREEKRKYKQLAAAIKAGDLEGVRTALKDGADAGFFPGDTKKLPLALALQQGDADIFKELMQTQGGQTTLVLWHYDFRDLKLTTAMNDHLYFLPSFLYAAIEDRQQDIALLLLDSPLVRHDKSGDLMVRGAVRLDKFSAAYALMKTPLALARDMGLPKVVAVLEEKHNIVSNIQKNRDAEELEKIAAQKQAEAEALLREAAALKQQAGEQPKPHAPGGFRL